MATIDLPVPVHVTVDGRSVEVAEGRSVLDAINASGAFIPQLCKDPDGKVLGACRTCLVKIEGQRGFPASCSTPATEGMVISTSAPDLDRIRRGVLELTAGMNPDGDALSGHGDLSQVLEHFGIGVVPPNPTARFYRDDSNPFFLLNMADCILCGRCAMACDDIQHIGAISMLGRGQDSGPGRLWTFRSSRSNCTSCGQCVASCPTGALRPKAAPQAIAKDTRPPVPTAASAAAFSCRRARRSRFCGSPTIRRTCRARGMLCVKGRFGTTFVNHPDRLTRPLVRKRRRAGSRRPGTRRSTRSPKASLEHRGSFAAFASAKATNEDGYVMQKFVRACDGHQQHRPLHAPLPLAFGRGDAAVGGQRRHQQLVQRLRGRGCLIVVGCDRPATTR